jgi:hypothetical protein
VQPQRAHLQEHRTAHAARELRATAAPAALCADRSGGSAGGGRAVTDRGVLRPIAARIGARASGELARRCSERLEARVPTQLFIGRGAPSSVGRRDDDSRPQRRQTRARRRRRHRRRHRCHRRPTRNARSRPPQRLQPPPF